MNTAPRTLRLVPYDHAWPAAFAAEKARIESVLGTRALQIEHVGSTSVPGLLAKPVIDIAVAVTSEGEANACVEPLRTLGYAYRGMHGDDPARRYYVLVRGGRRVAQLHLWMLPAGGWEEQLRFRDLLRVRLDLARAYAREKRRVAEEVRWDQGAYSKAKGPFIEAVLWGVGRTENEG